MNSASITEYVERAVDSDGEVSLREFLSKIYVRPRLFWTCVLLPPLLAMLLTVFVPPQWQATAKILIRYSSSESPFLHGLIPDDRPALSGSSSAELIKSIPTLAETVQREHIEPGDIYRKPTEVLTGYVTDLLAPLFPQESGPTLPGIDARTLAIANGFKRSLQSTAGFGMASKSKNGVEVLEKFSQLPATMQGDELIEITVPSFNRLKVAAMTNGLAQAFIDDYYRVSAEDAHRAYDFLSTLVDNAEKAAAPEQAGGASPAATSEGTHVAGGSDQIYRASPLLEGIARDLAESKTKLSHLREIYSEDSPEVVRSRQQVESLERTLGSAQSVEVGKQTLEELKARRYQAYNTEMAYRNRLVPISIIEPAMTPKGSLSKYVIRVIAAGIVGLLLGLILGTALVVILGVLDQRLFTSWDVQRTVSLPLLGWLPEAAAPAAGSVPGHLDVDAENGLLQILGRLDPVTAEGRSRALVIASATRGEGKSFVCLQLAGAFVRGSRNRVLLIDADPIDRSLTRHFSCENQPGFVDAVIAGRSLIEFVRPSGVAGLDLVPAGSVARRGEMGFYRRGLMALLDEARGQYDLLLIDTPALLTGNEALMGGMVADSVLLVAESGATRRPLIRQALLKLKEVGVTAQGVILNRRKKLLPDWLYRNV